MCNSLVTRVVGRTSVRHSRLKSTLQNPESTRQKSKQTHDPIPSTPHRHRSALPHAIEEIDDEISLLDLLQVVVDNLRLLVLGNFATGLPNGDRHA